MAEAGSASGRATREDLARGTSVHHAVGVHALGDLPDVGLVDVREDAHFLEVLRDDEEDRRLEARDDGRAQGQSRA